MRGTRHFALGAVALLVIAVSTEGTASAQLLPPSNQRCANAINVTQAQAQARYAWALYCRNNPGDRPVYHYLSDQSVTDYGNAASSLRPWLFPVYYDFIFATTWDVPNGAGTNCLLLPMSAVHAGLCVAGCYEESTPLRFADGDLGIKAALGASKLDLVTLSDTATLDNLQYANNRVENYTVDKYEAWQVLYTLTMRSGGVLRVTSEHPLLTSDGIMRQAQGLRVGDELVRADGSADAIRRIDSGQFYGKVYNVKPVTFDYTSNIVIAGGYLNGSQRYQNEFLDTVNSLILRRALAEQAAKLLPE